MTETAVAKLPPIPIGRGPRGRLVAAQRRKRLAGVAALWCIGITPSVLDLPLPWRALGLGLILPGAGELYRGYVWLFVAVLAFAAVAHDDRLELVLYPGKASGAATFTSIACSRGLSTAALGQSRNT